MRLLITAYSTYRRNFQWVAAVFTGKLKSTDLYCVYLLCQM